MSSSADVAQKLKELLKEVPEERADALRLDELRRIFAKLIATGQLSFDAPNSNTDDDAKSKWNTFLKRKHAQFVAQLCERIQQGRKTSVRSMWGVIASSPLTSENKQHKRVNGELLYAWLKSMTCIETLDKALTQMVEQEFLHQYRDVQYYALVSITKLAKELYAQLETIDEQGVDEKIELACERLFQLLLMIPVPTSQEDMEQSNYLFESVTVEEEDDGGDNDDDESVASIEPNESDNENDSGGESSDEDNGNDEAPTRQHSSDRKRKRSSPTFQQVKSHKKALSSAWLAVLKLPLSNPAIKTALQFLPTQVIPHTPNPLLFADFLTQAYGSSSDYIGVLALDGLFLLVTKYGLEYPSFYSNLYRLVQPKMLYVKYRLRFFELLDKCLCRNELLPAHLVAAFVKRMLRAALNSPPPGILFSLALVGNLLRKHQECAALIHRDVGGGDENEATKNDPFDAETNDPTQTRALESSLWELSAMQHHYYPPVVTLAKSIGTESDSTPLHDVDDFVRHTYKSLFEQERKRATSKKRRKVALTFVEPSGLFANDGEGNGDILSGMLNLSG